ncbi:hypothetical protein [Ferruginibacter sp.]|nr:hypothetical protein [Ferruginibacter sp.]
MKLQTKIILAVVGLASTLYFYTCYKDYYSEYDFVEDQLNKIDGIKIISIDGSPDLTLEVYSATIQLKDGNILSFLCDFSGKGFKETGTIDITRINNWEFHGAGCLHGTHWNPGYIDVSQNSTYKEIRKFDIKNIRDAIKHFNEINALLNKIPTYPEFDTIVKNTDTLFFQKFDNKKVVDSLLKTTYCR